MHEELSEYFEKNFRLAPEVSSVSLHQRFSSESYIFVKDYTYGDGINASVRLCTALCNFFNSYFKPHRPVVSKQIMTGAGVLPTLADLSGVIANRGEGIMLAAPFYHGFEHSLGIANGIVTVAVPVPVAELQTLAELDYLERSLQESKTKGTVIKAVILCNPHNPLGRCYPPEAIEAYFQFCEKHNLHLISDEIYALSLFPSSDVPNPEPFVSTLSYDLEAMGVNPSRLHVLYGMSKDFNANGFRAGVIVSQYNPLLMMSVTPSALFNRISSPTDILWSTLLADENYLPKFIEQNQLKLRVAYEHITSWLKFHGIPYVPASAGHFLMVDFRAVLSNMDKYASILPITEDKNMVERESALNAFWMQHKVMPTPGASEHAEPGWFRFTFSIRRDYIDVALRRIEVAMKWNEWDGLSVSKAAIGASTSKGHADLAEAAVEKVVG